MSTHRMNLFLNLSQPDEGGDATELLRRMISSVREIGTQVDQVICLLPVHADIILAPLIQDSWTFLHDLSPIDAMIQAFEKAAGKGADLLLIRDLAVPDAQTVGKLIDTTELDPFFGSIIPRFRDPLTRDIAKIEPCLGDPELNFLMPSVLEHVKEYYIVPEFVAPCMLLRHELVANFGVLDKRYKTLEGALLHYLCRARRVGYRCLILNTAIINAQNLLGDAPSDELENDKLKLDLIQLAAQYPCSVKARKQFEGMSFHEHESLVSRVIGNKNGLKKTLLLDMTGIEPVHNGTSEAALNIAGALHDFDFGWKISVVAWPRTISYHKLNERFPRWPILNPQSTKRFSVGVRMNQPWGLEDLVQLHQKVFFAVFTMLDTIIWDIMYARTPTLIETWDILAAHADGIIYISDFTRERFNIRFQVSPSVREYVSHLSVDPTEYMSHDLGKSSAIETTVLVIGNDYDHKWMGPTIELLYSTFPEIKLTALGYVNKAFPRLNGIPSGHIPQNKVEELYAKSTVIVFPSFYEGFGFPIIKGLSHGKTVIARRSSLAAELAGIYSGPGELLVFDNPSDLVEKLRCVLDSVPNVNSILRVPAIGQPLEPLGWKDVAAGIIEFVDGMLKDPYSSMWQSREKEIARFINLQALACPASHKCPVARNPGVAKSLKRIRAKLGSLSRLLSRE